MRQDNDIADCHRRKIQESDMGRLDGKIAIITGASGGIGAAAAAKLLDEGAKVMLAGRDKARLDAVAGALGCGANIATHIGDPAEEADVERLITETKIAFGGVDIMFANAGSEGAVAPLTLISVADFDAVQRVNVRGTWLAIKHAAPAMIERGGGSIICTSSVAGCVGVAGLAAYAASKHAVNGLVHVASLEFAKLGVRVNSIAPGPIDNAMMASVEKQASPDDPSLARTGFSALIAMGRYGQNEEVAGVVAFLASDDSRYCTGTVIPVDGGFLAA
jgi:NAD(P)-dependent dehydrogenase (short-subunit alcohol dehydrogenase family)